MTLGGNTINHMHDANARNYNGDKAGSCHTKEAYDHQKANHDGNLACNTEEANKKSAESLRALWRTKDYQVKMAQVRESMKDENGLLPWNREESQIKGRMTKAANDPTGKGNPMYGCIMNDSLIKRAATWMKNREQKLSTEEGRKKEEEVIRSRMNSNRNNHGGVLAWNTPEANKKKGVNAALTRRFNKLSDAITDLKSKHLELSINNIKNYYSIKTWDSLIEHLNDLIKDPRWTDEMQSIFK